MRVKELEMLHSVARMEGSKKVNDNKELAIILSAREEEVNSILLE